MDSSKSCQQQKEFEQSKPTKYPEQIMLMMIVDMPFEMSMDTLHNSFHDNYITNKEYYIAQNLKFKT